jgi:pyruvate dehydrogenase E2 component (dihydrolipoamide acetyltransferase)
MKTVEMPKMGDTMEEGKILRWLKKEGDIIKKGEPIAEVETDKVNIEIESFFGGTLRRILVPEGASAPIGAKIAYIGAVDEPIPGEAARTNGAQAASAPAAASTQAAPLAAQPAVAMAPGTSNGGTSTGGRIFISPVARKLAAEHQFDYTHIRGTGPNGRIIKMDVEAAIAAQQAAAAQPTPAYAGQPVAPTAPALAYAPTPAAPGMPIAPAPEEVAAAPVSIGDVVEIPLTAMRRTIARRLSQSMQTAPHIYVTSVIDTGKLAALRQQINEYAAKDPQPIKVSFNDLIVKAVARALVKIPEINVSFAEDRLIQKKQVHVGVAVALEQGLIVPVVRNADQRSMLDLAREIHRLTEAARAGKLRPEDYSGGTFTVSNLGMFDVDSFTAVINPPESAILAVGSITPTPAVVDGQIVIRDRMKVTLSADHRAVDGAIAARFLQEVKRLLEEPFGLLV